VDPRLLTRAEADRAAVVGVADRVANGTDVFVTGEIFESDPNGSERKEWEALFEQGQVPSMTDPLGAAKCPTPERRARQTLSGNGKKASLESETLPLISVCHGRDLRERPERFRAERVGGAV
jgi:hypothetical protein